MELADIRAFVAVSRERNIGRAAASIQLTPSPVSRTIRRLERELGGPLFERRYHDVGLTALGDQLLPGAVETLAQAERLKNAGSHHPIRVGGTPWAPLRYTNQLVELAQTPGAGMNALAAADISSNLLHSIRHHDLDVAIVHLPVLFDGIATRPLARYRFQVVAHREHELLAKDVLTLADLAGHPLISMPAEMQPLAMDPMIQRVSAAGITDVTILELRDWVSMSARLRQLNAITLGLLSPDTPLSRLIEMSDLVCVPLAEGEIDFLLGVAWRSNDGLLGEQIRDIVSRLHPGEGQPLDVIG